MSEIDKPANPLETGVSLDCNDVICYDPGSGGGAQQVLLALAKADESKNVAASADEKKLSEKTLDELLSFLVRADQYRKGDCTTKWNDHLDALNEWLRKNSVKLGIDNRELFSIHNGARLPVSLTIAWQVRDVWNTPRRFRHEGIDISGKGIYGASVSAVEGGIIVGAFEDVDYGNSVYIYHPGKNVTTHYAHLKSCNYRMPKQDRPIQEIIADADKGKLEKVDRGDEVGHVGDTGDLALNAATGERAIHLHFAIYQGLQWNRNSIDPLTCNWGDALG